MKQTLYDYDVFPKVFLTGKKTELTVKSLGCNTAFDSEGEYTVLFRQDGISEERHFEGSGCTQTFKVVPNKKGELCFDVVCENEDMYLIQLVKPGEQKKYVEFRVYALAHDMEGRYPLRGDLHLHSCKSDGDDDPAFVAANYRGHGYDFMALTDHRRYYPSLLARKAMHLDEKDSSDITDLLVATGEEVQLPLTDIHYINFGGSYSLNALISPNCNQEADGDSVSQRSRDGKCPEVLSYEEYEKQIRDLAKDVDRPLESERLAFAALIWTYRHMNANGGLGIFAHPYWRCTTCHVSEDFTRYIYEKKPFDAFEVLGGELYFQQNGLQSILYYEEKAKGFDCAIVGSTDSHLSTENNKKCLICSTIVFSKANTTKEIVSSVKDKYSIAVDTISTEYRLTGTTRFAKYAAFLLEDFYPLHDALCQAEGLYLRRYLDGDTKAEKLLKSMKGQVPAMLEKYFHLS